MSTRTAVGRSLFLALLIGSAGFVLAGPQDAKKAAPKAAPKTSEQVFKNIQVLKGISVDDFMGTMGIMTSSLGMDCSECHLNAGTEKVDWAADTPRKIMARRMVQMVGTINKEQFGGRQMITCWSCHRGRDRPLTTPTLANVYGPVESVMDDALAPQAGQPSATEIFDKYIQAAGGAEKVGAMKSFVAKGSSVSFGGFGGGGHVELIAKFPDQRATFITFDASTKRDPNMRTYNGRSAWLRTPLTILGGYQLTGGELDGARVDALASFPGQIKTAFSRYRVSMPVMISDLVKPTSQSANAAAEEHLANVVQGTGPHGMLVTLYFDKATGLLNRLVRFPTSPIGRYPTQVDFSDYRDVDGVKLPFHLVFAWLGGLDVIQLSEAQINVPIDSARFGRPAANTAAK